MQGADDYYKMSESYSQVRGCWLLLKAVSSLRLYPLGIQPDSASNTKGGGRGTEEKHNFRVLVILLPIALREYVPGRKNEREVQTCFSLIPQVPLLA